jgi:hypothetical protein
MAKSAIQLRWNHPALRGENVRPFIKRNDDRVIAFHRWLDSGDDVIIVGTLAEKIGEDLIQLRHRFPGCRALEGSGRKCSTAMLTEVRPCPAMRAAFLREDRQWTASEHRRP